MPFMVIYRTSDGTSRYEQADAIDEAALFVERLRNSEGIDQIRIYRMEEISFAFRPYYKVELGLPERQVSPPTDTSAVPEVSDPPVAPADDAVIDDAPDTEVALDAPLPVEEGRRGSSARSRRSRRPRPSRRLPAATASTRAPTDVEVCSVADAPDVGVRSSQRLVEHRRQRDRDQSQHRGHAHPEAGQEQPEQAG